MPAPLTAPNMNNPYAAPEARVEDTPKLEKTPWGRAATFYFAFLWRWLILFGGMGFAFSASYGIIKLFLDSWPLAERLIRLAAILALATLASSFAIQWAARATFGNFVIRIMSSEVGKEWGGPAPADLLTLGRAARLFWAHIWRYILVVAPVNVLLTWLFFGRVFVPPSERGFHLAEQAITIPLGIVGGIWAMREALGVS